MTDLHIRTAPLRAANDETRTVSGIAVPWKTPAPIRDWLGSYTETFERGSVELPDSGKVMLFWRHDEPIGIVTEHRDDEAGWFVSARISETPRGDEVYALLRDGVVTEFSVGFEPVEHHTDDETGDITRTRVIAREVSIVPFGAYGSEASITQVREREPHPELHPERITMNTTTDLTEVRERLDDIERRQATFATRDERPVLDLRTAGEVLKAIASGDEQTIRGYNDLHERAYTGGTSADAVVKPGWVGDLTRIFDASSGVLADTFSTGTLPATGNSIEFAELSASTLSVAEQANEGDDIAAGKVSITTRTAPVKTYAGSTTLTRQEVERASVGVLNTSLNGLTIAAGARKKAALRAAYEALMTARESISSNGGVVLLGATLAAGTASHWEDTLVDAALKFETLSLPLERLIVSASVFKKLRSLTVAGERVFQVAEKNSSGTLDLPGLKGDFASIPVLLDSGASGDKAAFVNSLALRSYDSPLVSLSDEAISNLTKSFAVYKYGAVAAEIPAAVVPVKLAAS